MQQRAPVPIKGPPDNYDETTSLHIRPHQSARYEDEDEEEKEEGNTHRYEEVYLEMPYRNSQLYGPLPRIPRNEPGPEESRYVSVIG